MQSKHKYKHKVNMYMKGVRIHNGNLTQTQAAERMGYTQQYYSRVERGQIDGCVDFWRKFKEAFNLSQVEAWAIMNNEPVEKLSVVC